MSHCSYCCDEGIPPALSVARITCGFQINTLNYHSSIRDDIPADLISHMRFQRLGAPLNADYTWSEEFYECCTTPDPDVWVLAFERQWTATGMQYIQSYEYRLEDACGSTDPPCCQSGLKSVAGSATWYEYAANCSGGGVVTDASAVEGSIIGGAPFMIWNGTINYVSRTDYALSFTPYGPLPGLCDDGIYTTVNDDYVLSPQADPIGIIQTRTLETSSSGFPSDPNCGASLDACSSSGEIVSGYDTPDPFRLRFTFTPQNTPPIANHCRVIAKLYFTPWDWDLADWGEEVEQALLDFKWKTGDDPYIHEEAYPSLGKFRLGIVSVYLAGKGIPERYEFTP